MIYTAMGTMSGTSMDGIDIALMKTDGLFQIEEIANTSIRYPDWFHTLLKAAEYTVRQCQGNLTRAAESFSCSLQAFLQHELQVNTAQLAAEVDKLTSEFYKAAKKQLSLDNIIFYSTCLHQTAIELLLQQIDYPPTQIDVVGYHGQTLWHKPQQRITIQVGDSQYLAQQLGIKVVADFRINDVQHGGQGAPFAPLYHQALAQRDNLLPCAIINCGGVSNVTVINGPTPADLLSFDIGPGNGLIDRFVRLRTQGQMQMDTDGQFGLAGKVDKEVLNQLCCEALCNEQAINFLNQPPPKSLDIADFKLIPALDKLSLEDGCATLEAFTAQCIANSLKLIENARPNWSLPSTFILAGGGWYNPVIKHELTRRLPEIKLVTAKQMGWNNKALEAQIFAYLAVRCLQNLPISFPETTGAPYPLSGGKIYLA